MTDRFSAEPHADGAPAAQTAFDMHGPIRVAEGGRHLAHTDGTPFFYLADTAWNGVLLSGDADWREYLADRRAKGFTAIQFILMAPWAGAYTDADGATAFSQSNHGGPRINEKFFDRADARIAAINDAGLLAVPVLAWAAPGKSARQNPGMSLPTPFLAELIEYQVARYRGFHVMWLLAGDGRYGGLRSIKWKRIGRRVFGKEGRRAPVGLHPMGRNWPYRSFRRESWLDVIGYQSGHSDDPDTLRWLLNGPPASTWKNDSRPVLNVEPCYEGIRNWGGKQPFTNVEVRRAMYASLLNAPTAGVTYGAHGVWSWESEAREPLNHGGCGIAPPWREAMRFPGSDDVRRMAELFRSIEWWRLRPEPALVRVQPGDREPAEFISAAATERRDLAVLYVPRGGEVALDPRMAQGAGEWFDPSRGTRSAAEICSKGRYRAPSEEDWVLIFGAASVK